MKRWIIVLLLGFSAPCLRRRRPPRFARKSTHCTRRWRSQSAVLPQRQLVPGLEGCQPPATQAGLFRAQGLIRMPRALSMRRRAVA